LIKRIIIVLLLLLFAVLELKLGLEHARQALYH
jgi:hypothetical protein